MNRICENCARYKSYYHTGVFCFWEAYCGICENSGETVDFRDGCDLWLKRPPERTKLTVAQIDKAIDDVNAIAAYFKSS